MVWYVSRSFFQIDLINFPSYEAEKSYTQGLGRAFKKRVTLGIKLTSLSPMATEARPMRPPFFA